MFASVATVYRGLKCVVPFSLVRIRVKSEPMKDHWLFLRDLFTAEAGATMPSPDAAGGGLIKKLGERARETVNEAQKQP